MDCWTCWLTKYWPQNREGIVPTTSHYTGGSNQPKAPIRAPRGSQILFFDTYRWLSQTGWNSQDPSRKVQRVTSRRNFFRKLKSKKVEIFGIQGAGHEQSLERMAEATNCINMSFIIRMLKFLLWHSLGGGGLGGPKAEYPKRVGGAKTCINRTFIILLNLDGEHGKFTVLPDLDYGTLGAPFTSALWAPQYRGHLLNFFGSFHSEYHGAREQHGIMHDDGQLLPNPV